MHGLRQRWLLKISLIKKMKILWKDNAVLYNNKEDRMIKGGNCKVRNCGNARRPSFKDFM